MQTLNLCIDIDGTVTEPYYWLPKANEYFNTHVKPEEIHVYEIHDVLGINIADYNEFYEEYGIQLHKEAKIRFLAKEVIRRLYNQHKIHFVSAREERMRDISIEWLKEYKIPMDSLTLLGHTNKVEKATELACDIFIEDRYENAIQLAQAGFHVLLIHTNYNKGPLPTNVTRIKNWSQIDKFIDNYSKQYHQYKLNDYREACI